MNSGLVGGAIYIDFLKYADQNILIENSDFEENYSANGGVIGVDFNVLNFTGIIRKNYFFKNWAACKKLYNLAFLKFFDKIFNKIF